VELISNTKLIYQRRLFSR